MNNSITLTLVKPLILESVKNETYQKGNFDKAADPKALTMAYVEQAGNEEHHTRMLLRSLSSNLEELKTHLSDYVASGGATSGDNVSLTENGDNIVLVLTVGDRFNHSMTPTLARLCAKYIEEGMLMDWYKPMLEKKAEFYAQCLERDLINIKRCFNKTAPKAPSIPYTSTIDVVGTSIDIGVGEESTISYTLSAGAIDDIEIRVADPSVCIAGRTEEGFTVKGKMYGHTPVDLYSRHNPTVTTTIQVYVVNQD